MKNKIDYKKIYEDIKNNKLQKYYDVYMKNKSEHNIRNYVLGCFCKNISDKHLLEEDKCLEVLKKVDKLLNIRVE